jgi:magnesium-transporting ATPase (P-type)
VQDIITFKYASVSMASQYTSPHACLEACDVTITNELESFLTLLPAILESRRAMENLRKTVLFVLTSTSAKIMAVALYIFAGTPLPINQTLMLAVSSLTDLLTAIGFAREEAEPTIKARYKGR